MSRVYIFFLILFLLKNNGYSKNNSLKNIFNYKLSLLEFNSGNNWSNQSLFEDYLINKKATTYIFIENSNKNISFSNISQYHYKKNFYVYFYSNIGLRTYPKRLNQNMGEDPLKFNKKLKIEYSGIGYKNDWLDIEFSRGMEDWGTGENIALALSKDSEPYEYLQIFSNYGNLRVKYIYGFLETTSQDINRFITARGLEWNNKKSILIGISETVIYSGKDRGPEFGYINPISSHLEVELNNRLSIIGDGTANAVWQFHIDMLLKKKYRFSANILFDEFVFDPNIELDKEHGKAHSAKLSYSNNDSPKSLITMYIQNIYVGSPTFRHGIGTNNFVQNSSPLGWSKGSDMVEYSIGLNYTNKTSLLFLLESGIKLSGDENIKNRVFDRYLDYKKGSFPSGEVKKTSFFNSNLEWWMNDSLSIFLNSYIIYEEYFTSTLSIGLRFSINKKNIKLI